MQINQENLNTLSASLTASISADSEQRRKAEGFLLGARGQPGFAMLLFTFLSNDQVPVHLRGACAVQFKNLIKAGWDSEPPLVSEEEKASVREQLPRVMLTLPEGSLRKLLSESLTLISITDFPARWPNLAETLVARCTPQDLGSTADVMHTMHLVFKRYRHKYKTEEVVRELLHILGVVFQPLLQIFQVVVPLAQQDQAPAARLMLACVKVFYDLNCVDLPERFEDNMAAFMGGFIAVLQHQSTAVSLNGDDEEVPSLLQRLQSNVCQCITLYATKYDEEFVPYLQGFTQATWELAVRCLQANQGRSDKVIAQAIAFLTAVANGPHHAVFANGDVLKSICEKVVIPAMTLRQQDVEMFEDSPGEYIQRDLEGADTDTRRRSAQELVKALRRNYEAQTTPLFGEYIQLLLSSNSWHQKDVAIFLLTALTVTTFRRAAGSTTVNPLVPLLPFFESTVLPVFTAQQEEHPIIVADALKFVYVFRLQLTAEHYQAVLQPLVQRYLPHRVWVVHSYAAFALEHLVRVRERVTLEHLQPLVQPILQHLFQQLEAHQQQPNVYVMRCLVRVLQRGKELLQPVVQPVLQRLAQLLRAAALNPQRPLYNHYLFEGIAVLVRCDPQQVPQFDAVLHPIFEEIIRRDVLDFLPYTFQVLAQLLHAHPQVPEPYWGIFSLVVDQHQWERQGNVPALISLLAAYIARGGPRISGDPQHMQSVMWIWQKLNSMPKHDSDSAALVRALIRYLPLQTMNEYVMHILGVTFKRLSMPKGKTPAYVRGFVVWSLFFCAMHGGDELVARCNQLQPGIFQNVLQLIVNHMRSISDRTERKYAALGAIKLLCDTQAMQQPEYAAAWAPLLQALIGFFELPEVHDDVEEGQLDVVEDNQYARLQHAAVEDDPFPQVQQPHLQLARSLADMKTRVPDLTQRIQQGLQPELQAKIQQYCSQAGVSL